MNKISTLWIVILLLLSGCAKETYYFSKAAGEVSSHQKNSKSSDMQAASSVNKIGTTVKADTSGAMAGAGLEIVSKKEIANEAKAIAHYLTAKNSTRINAVNAAKEKVVLNKLLKKTFAADEKPENKKGKVGFILGLSGLGLTLAGLFFGPLLAIGFLSSIAGIIFSALGLSEIKKNPDHYAGNKKAKAGLIISITSVALTVLFALLMVLVIAILFAGYGGFS